jgi:hypothetical protein
MAATGDHNLCEEKRLLLLGCVCLLFFLGLFVVTIPGPMAQLTAMVTSVGIVPAMATGWTSSFSFLTAASASAPISTSTAAAAGSTAGSISVLLLLDPEKPSGQFLGLIVMSH